MSDVGIQSGSSIDICTIHLAIRRIVGGLCLETCVCVISLHMQQVHTERTIGGTQEAPMYFR